MDEKNIDAFEAWCEGWYYPLEDQDKHREKKEDAETTERAKKH